MDDKEIQLTFKLGEINEILQVLGEVPSKYGVFNIILALKQRTDHELKTKEAEQLPKESVV